MKKAIIVGSGGQDGKIMIDFLKNKKYNVLGIERSKTTIIGSEFSQYKNKIINILNDNEVNETVKSILPDEIYYLAAYHHSSQDTVEDFLILLNNSYDVNVKGYGNFLEATRKFSSTTKIFYASSSLIFGGTDTTIQNEETKPCPNSIYGITKLDGMYLGKMYKDKYGIFVNSGILYNHESEYRSSKFVFMKVIQGALDIRNGKSDKLIIGNLSVQVDWGSAYDYVKAMYQMLQHTTSNDFIISSGEMHTVQELVEIVFDYVGLDWKKYVIEEKDLVYRHTGVLQGDPTNIIKDIGWNTTIGFKEMVLGILKKKQQRLF